MSGAGINGRQALQKRMQRPLVLHLDGDLDDQPATGGLEKQLREAWVIEGVAVIVGMEPDTGHLVHFVAAAELLAPVGQQGVDGTEGAQESRAVRATARHQALVHTAEVTVQERIEAAGPSLGHTQSLEPADKALPVRRQGGGGTASGTARHSRRSQLDTLGASGSAAAGA